ncbi:hypothetical protein [Actinophytocola sediminis]
MISFIFLPRIDDPSWGVDGLIGAPPRALTVNDFTFYYFTSDVLINDGCSEVLLRTPDLPVVEFILMLIQLCREVATSGVSTVETSQTQDSIEAAKVESRIRLTYSFSDVISTLSMSDLRAAPGRALRAAFEVLFSAHDDLKFNGYLIELADLIRSEFSDF